MKNTLTLKKMYLMFKTIRNHRKWVRYYCFLAHIPWRGITHDLSKYSPVEFFESARFYNGKESPINVAKREQGYSLAWLHHRGHNKHHNLYWYDNIEEGGKPLLMPEKDFIELVCDWLGACHTYNTEFSYYNEYVWWKKKRATCAIHEKHKIMLDIIFSDLAALERAKYNNATPEQLIRCGYLQGIYRANI